jgi:hypothetical protein
MSSWKIVLSNLLSIEMVLRKCRAEASFGRHFRNEYRNTHPLDAPLNNVRERIQKIRTMRGSVNG